MRKQLLIACFFISFFSFAQKTDQSESYHFNLLLEISSPGEFAEQSKFKIINTMNDNYEIVSGNLDFLNVHDFKGGYVHSFKKVKQTDEEDYIYTGSSKKISTRNGYYVKVKKLLQNKYQLTRYDTKYNRPSQTIIIDLEDFEYNAANSLHINDVLFLDSRYLKILRRKEKNRNFIIRSYQTMYDDEKNNYYSLVKSEKLDINLTLPKKLIIFQRKNPRENL